MLNEKKLNVAEKISVEKEKKPKYRLMITRHAERLPDGSLSPEGIKSSKRKGEMLKDSAEVVKGYASDEKTKRTVKTSELISQSSETNSPLTGDYYKTREVKDIQYEILLPDLASLMKQAAATIDKATIEELGLSEDTVLKNLPEDEQERIAPIRQKNQELGFRMLIKSPEGVHRMAMGLAAQLEKEINIAKRYENFRRKEDKPLEKNAILDTVTHGMFSESLFLEAGFIKGNDGSLEKIKNSDFETTEFGGYIMPSESYVLEIKNPNNIPDMIPVNFMREDRPAEGCVFVAKDKLIELADEYKKWRSKK